MGDILDSDEAMDLVHFPFLSYRVVASTYQEFYRPYNEREEDVHPSPPHLRRMIKYCKYVSLMVVNWS